MQIIRCRSALLVLVVALLSSSCVFAGILVELFKDANFQGERAFAAFGRFSDCVNLRENLNNEISSLRWTSTATVTYTHNDWLIFYDGRDCTSGSERFHVFANESNYYRDLAVNHFDNKISSSQYMKVITQVAFR